MILTEISLSCIIQDVVLFNAKASENRTRCFLSHSSERIEPDRNWVGRTSEAEIGSLLLSQALGMPCALAIPILQASLAFLSFSSCPSYIERFLQALQIGK